MSTSLSQDLFAAKAKAENLEEALRVERQAREAVEARLKDCEDALETTLEGSREQIKEAVALQKRAKAAEAQVRELDLCEAQLEERGRELVRVRQAKEQAEAKLQEAEAKSDKVNKIIGRYRLACMQAREAMDQDDYDWTIHKGAAD